MRVFGWIVHAQYWILNKATFQLVKGLLFVLCPLPVYIAGEMIQGFANATEVLDRSVVEICKFLELLDIRHIEGSRPLLNTLYFYRIHLNMVVGHQDTQILNFRDFKLAFLGSKIEIVFFQTAKNLVDDTTMLREVTASDEYVVQVDGDLAFCD